MREISCLSPPNSVDSCCLTLFLKLIETSNSSKRIGCVFRGLPIAFPFFIYFFCSTPLVLFSYRGGSIKNRIQTVSWTNRSFWILSFPWFRGPSRRGVYVRFWHWLGRNLCGIRLLFFARPPAWTKQLAHN